MTKYRVTVEFEVPEYIKSSGDSPEQIFRDCVIVNALEGNLDALFSAYKTNNQEYIDHVVSKSKLIKSIQIVSTEGIDPSLITNP